MSDASDAVTFALARGWEMEGYSLDKEDKSRFA